jgi:hypothetical protein
LQVAVGEDDWTAVAAAVAKEGVPGGEEDALREEEETAVGAEDVDGFVKDLAVAAHDGDLCAVVGELGSDLVAGAGAPAGDQLHLPLQDVRPEQ